MNASIESPPAGHTGQACPECAAPAPDGYCSSCGSWRCEVCLGWHHGAVAPAPWLVDLLACPGCEAADLEELLGLHELALSVGVDEDLGAVVVHVHGLEAVLGGQLVVAPAAPADLALRLIGCACRARRAQRR
jgi:hypothetical protein